MSRRQSLLRFQFRQLLRTCIASSLLALPALGAFPVVSRAQEPTPVVDPSTLPMVEAGEPPTLPETVVEAAPEFGQDPFFEEGAIYDPVVDGSRLSSPLVDGYRAGSSTAGTLLDIDDADVPFTVNSIPRDVINDQQALEFGDIARNAGGTSIGGGDAFFADSILLRGLQVTSRDFRRDGFLDPTYVPRDFQSIERVEILKGPASVLYGAGSPSGMINLVTKKPEDRVIGDFGFTFGSYERQRYTLDVGGRANESGNVLYRVNVAHEDANNFVDFDFLSRTLVAPSITWTLNESTRITWQGEYHKDHRRGFQGVPAIGGDALALSPNTFVGDPFNDFVHYEEFRQSLVLTHELSDEWTFQFGGSSLFYEYPASVTGGAQSAGGTNYFRSRSDFTVADEQSQSVIANLAGDGYVGEFRHRMVLGMEYVYFDSNSSLTSSGLFEAPIDAANPVYNPPLAVIPQFTADFPVFRQQRVGGYIQDLIDINEHWKVLGGVRFDTVNFEFDRTFSGPALGGMTIPASTDQHFNRISPRGGIVFQPWGDESLACYFNYSQSFAPPGGGVYVNPDLQPITGETYEIGIKTMLLPELSLNVAGFYTTRENAEIGNRSFFVSQVGEERSQGVEMNLVGQITDQWSWIANYTYADVSLFDPAFSPDGVTTIALDGQQQRNSPLNSANFWTRYNLWQNEVDTLGAAIGFVYSDSRPGDLLNTFELPSYGRWDAGLFYRRDRWNAQVYVENLFDVHYATSSIDANQVFFGAPLNARAQVSFSY